MEAVFKQNAGQQDYTADANRTAGEIIQLADGRAGFVKTDLLNGEKGAVWTHGIFEVQAESATTFSVGETVWWDASANYAINQSNANYDDFPIGVAVAAKASGEFVVLVDLNETGGAELGGLRGLIQSDVIEVDCDGTANAVLDLIPAAQNLQGLLFLGAIGIVSEVFAGGDEDQAVVTVEDTDDGALGTLTPSDAGADAVGDMILSTNAVLWTSATGAAAKTVAAGKGVRCQVTTPTSGAGAAGKMKVRALFLPLV